MTRVIVQRHLADDDRWYPVFPEHEAIRRQNGATGHSINREVTDPNTIVIVNEFATRLPMTKGEHSACRCDGGSDRCGDRP